MEDMSETSGTPEIVHSLPGIRQTVLRGVWLGVQSSLVGSVVFLVVSSLLVSLVNPWVDTLSIGSVDGALLFWFIAFALAGFVVAVGPGGIGGIIIGLILRWLAWRHKLSTGIALLLGVLVGACSGGLAVYIAWLLEPELVEQSSVENFVAALLSAGLAGVWHSWRFTRWLQKDQPGLRFVYS